MSAILTTKTWLTSSKQCPKKANPQYHQASTKLTGNSLQSYRKQSDLQGAEPTFSSTISVFQQVVQMKKGDGPAMLCVTEEQAELLLAV